MKVLELAAAFDVNPYQAGVQAHHSRAKTRFSKALLNFAVGAVLLFGALHVSHMNFTRDAGFSSSSYESTPSYTNSANGQCCLVIWNNTFHSTGAQVAYDHGYTDEAKILFAILVVLLGLGSCLSFAGFNGMADSLSDYDSAEFEAFTDLALYEY